MPTALTNEDIVGRVFGDWTVLGGPAPARTKHAALERVSRGERQRHVARDMGVDYRVLNLWVRGRRRVA